MELLLNQQEADELIAMLKVFLRDNFITLEDGTDAKIDISSKQHNREFILYIHYARNNCHLNFMDCSTKINLIRINLNGSFHKNANGDIIRGNRVNLFCEDEYNQREDGIYMRAYKLPYNEILKEPKTFIDALDELINYINLVDNRHKLQVTPSIFDSGENYDYDH